MTYRAVPKDRAVGCPGLAFDLFVDYWRKQDRFVILNHIYNCRATRFHDWPCRVEVMNGASNCKKIDMSRSRMIFHDATRNPWGTQAIASPSRGDCIRGWNVPVLHFLQSSPGVHGNCILRTARSHILREWRGMAPSGTKSFARRIRR